MDSTSHAERIINILVSEYSWPADREWKTIEMIKSYKLVFIEHEYGTELAYKVNVNEDPEFVANDIMALHRSPVNFKSKLVEEEKTKLRKQRLKRIRKMPRRQRRKALRGFIKEYGPINEEE